MPAAPLSPLGPCSRTHRALSSPSIKRALVLCNSSGLVTAKQAQPVPPSRHTASKRRTPYSISHSDQHKQLTSSCAATTAVRCCARTPGESSTTVRPQQSAADGASAPAPGSLCRLPLASAKTPSRQTPAVAALRLLPVSAAEAGHLLTALQLERSSAHAGKHLHTLHSVMCSLCCTPVS